MIRKSLMTMTVTMLLAGSAMAQPPGGGGPPGGFMASLPPAAQAKMKAWRTWRDNHKNFQQLTSTIRAISEMDKEPATKLTKDQAKKIMAVVAPWQAKPVMTDDQARAVTNGIAKVLNNTQIKKYAALQAAGGRGGWGGGGGRGGAGGAMGGPGGGGPPGGGGGFGGPPGGGGAGGGRGSFDFTKMSDPKEYNPLNPASYPVSPMSERSKQRVTDFMKLLKTRAV